MTRPYRLISFMSLFLAEVCTLWMLSTRAPCLALLVVMFAARRDRSGVFFLCTSKIRFSRCVRCVSIVVVLIWSEELMVDECVYLCIPCDLSVMDADDDCFTLGQSSYISL